MSLSPPIVGNPSVPAYKPLQVKKEFKIEEIEGDFKKAQSKYFSLVGGVLGLGAIGLIVGSSKHGGKFSSQALRVTGDGAGFVASLLMPFILIKDELNNYKHHKIDLGNKENINDSGESSSLKKSNRFTDNLKGLFYRCLGLGFLPYVFETILDPDNINRSKTSLFSFIGNLPIIAFSLGAYGVGSLNSVIGWGLKQKAQSEADTTFDAWKALEDKMKVNVQNGNDQYYGIDEEEAIRKFEAAQNNSKKLFCNSRLFDSITRIVTLGSLTLPAMHGLKRWAEAVDSFLGDRSNFVSEVFKNPFTVGSRMISLVIGLPEAFAKAFDCVARVVQEREHLEPALPKFMHKPIKVVADIVDKQVTGDKNSFLKMSRNFAEIIFHTLSPLSTAAFVAPVMDKKVFNEDAQSKGGMIGRIDTLMGVIAKPMLYLINLPYVFISRIPQGLLQLSYFTKYASMKMYTKKDEKEIAEAMKKHQDSLCEKPFIKGMSNSVRKFIENKLVKNYYTVEHEYSFPTFDDIQVKFGYNHVEGMYKNELTSGKSIEAETLEKMKTEFKAYVTRSAQRAYQTIDENTLDRITEKFVEKVKVVTGEKSEENQKLGICFPGAKIIADFLRPFDMVTRIQALNSESPFHRMETAYSVDEIPTFNIAEYYMVLSESYASGFRNTVNRFMGNQVSTTVA